MHASEHLAFIDKHMHVSEFVVLVTTGLLHAESASLALYIYSPFLFSSPFFHDAHHLHFSSSPVPLYSTRNLTHLFLYASDVHTNISTLLFSTAQEAY